ncbi:ABC transporter ATP-binding protein/permease [Gemella sp. zg-1178]|uniref:ABC transporter ATP-binding protein/permease n=1 Tax=Gemella sp. zg-1178 TaxID=2840372 RepID=UPI001C0552CE|nr:ATP-binding cassette domain-containing protein [Gemella sp. zg-1178]MBU0278221.1 ATP-binding cassette domain-containing protein [Gemella sp. zg-1178]
MKIDKRALALFYIKTEVYLIAFCKVLTFLSSLYLTYNFVDLLFKLINKNADSSYLTLFILRSLFALIVYYLAMFFDNKISHEIAKKVRNLLRTEIYNKIEKLSLNYTEAVSTSSLLVMNSSSIVSIELYFNKFIPQVFATALIVISSLVIYGFISIWLSIAMLILYPLIPLSIMIIIKKSKKANKKTFTDFLSLSEVFFDRLQGFTVAKIYGKEANVSHEVDKLSLNYRKSTMQLLKHQLNSINVMDAITYLSIFIMSIIAILTLDNPIFIIFVIVASFECFKPLRAMGGLFHISMKASVELENIYKLLDYKEDAKDKNIRLAPGYDININNVDFAYDNKKKILKNINMTFRKSEKIALVGESGSGKSTLIKLLLGLKRVQKGFVKYADYNLADVDFKELAKIITLITSDSYLNADTIRNHLAVNENISEDEMFEVLEKVNLKDLVLENGGLDYKLAEGAANLSGGQRQRLLAAKAILKNSYIYILDESVSNIDDYSKKCVLAAFDSISKDKIILIISHDLEVTKDCDKIYVLKDGKILEEGSHIELINKNNLYANLSKEQTSLKNKFLAREVE